MKQSPKKNFLLSVSDKKNLKAGIIERMRTSFAIEGIYFTDKEISDSKKRIFRDEKINT